MSNQRLSRGPAASCAPCLCSPGVGHQSVATHDLRNLHAIQVSLLICKSVHFACSQLRSHGEALLLWMADFCDFARPFGRADLLRDGWLMLRSCTKKTSVV
ncbi:unnamed protein product [Symbiodinium natans]|uniref:Uncharacterized protein n=1 Tax=Symbiodinium natans TaxID=878477 RepID=A0A812M9B5_9DINO|nr:unnamed protein product [Symbiodinium natans]